MSSDAALSVNAVRGPYVGDLLATSRMPLHVVLWGATAGVYAVHCDSVGPGCCHADELFDESKVDATH